MTQSEWWVSVLVYGRISCRAPCLCSSNKGCHCSTLAGHGSSTLVGGWNAGRTCTDKVQAVPAQTGVCVFEGWSTRFDHPVQQTVTQATDLQTLLLCTLCHFHTVAVCPGVHVCSIALNAAYVMVFVSSLFSSVSLH